MSPLRQLVRMIVADAATGLGYEDIIVKRKLQGTEALIAKNIVMGTPAEPPRWDGAPLAEYLPQASGAPNNEGVKWASPNARATCNHCRQ